ncbi:MULTISPECIES: MarR family winged helix-turn-helix transcriptional regulator [unclassified Rhodococcus (in: high G+C Gram-positive bacteria)]|uniref:MarR family winged helix-turn-helix transcriptional regulator n=1 Tax=unclassified Rhodococcus (in: high G+C Gram-positive bacteria) TaxID=192944 RepID=UPI00146CCE28|nr:MarR family transcriptional regulator [Rhodococcus sp. (in: high G+C Gram-positive bacteria)]MBF0663138.1 MarR family transcriptional regulator [Rhodococcus sp. (in: high G+C Gram-positive bacteria)]NME78856.1 MarR family transcriptional regulator [Rhodococcus sp. 105337]
MSDPFALDQQVCFALYRASRATTAVYRPLLDRLGVTYPQYLVLLALWERDARGVQDLCDALDLDTGTLSPLLKRLESAGLVERTRQRDDERRVVVRLTDAGNALRKEAEGIPGCVARAGRLELEELAELRDTLHRLTAALQHAAGDTPEER